MKIGSDLIRDVKKTTLRRGQCALWWLGQQSFIIKLGQTTLFLDPFLSPHPRRRVAPLLQPEDITIADFILGTHDHIDHIDRAIWPTLAAASPQARFIIPKFHQKTLPAQLGIPKNRFIGLNDLTSFTDRHIRITGIPSAHELLDRDPKTGLYPFMGFIIEGNNFSLYHAGDCCSYEGLQTRLLRWKLDLAILPINGRDAVRYRTHCLGNFTYQEAADLAGAIQPGTTIPAHYDMFANNSENPLLFLDYMLAKYPKLNARMCRYAERIILE